MARTIYASDRREDSADLEKGLLLILFELEESRSSLVFRQAFDPVDEIDNEIAMGLDHFAKREG